MTYFCNSFIQKPGCASLTINPDHIWHYQVRLADEIPPIYAGFLKCAEHISLRILVHLFLCRNRRNIKTARIMILCVATATSLPLGAGAILFFLLHLDIDMITRPFFCLFLRVVLLIYRLFACYLFWPSIPHPVPNSPLRNLYIF